MKTGPSKGTGPTAKNRPSDNQPVTDNVEINNEPPTGNQSGTEPNKDIPEVQAQADSPPKKDASADPGSSSPVKVQGPARPRPEIITGKHILRTRFDPTNFLQLLHSLFITI